MSSSSSVPSLCCSRPRYLLTDICRSSLARFQRVTVTIASRITRRRKKHASCIIRARARWYSAPSPLAIPLLLCTTLQYFRTELGTSGGPSRGEDGQSMACTSSNDGRECYCTTSRAGWRYLGVGEQARIACWLYCRAIERYPSRDFACTVLAIADDAQERGGISDKCQVQKPPRSEQTSFSIEKWLA